MNELIKEMVRIAEETAAGIGEEYTTVEVKVRRSGGRTWVTFQGYTAPGGHAVECETLDEVAALIRPSKDTLAAKAQELREELAKVEALAGGAK
jgi:hypothetical protein